ncbi:MAG: hypothetical protein J2P25_07520 [Nocardiopsaceae bacterium]|nr:hypothetical protein [Nocardiopsaceae bacterium]
MTDQFTYLKHRMSRLESRVNMLEGVVRPESCENDAQPSPSPEPGQPGRSRQSEQPIPDGELRMINAVLWSIYDFVTSQSIGRTNDYGDIVTIKQGQESIGQRLESIEKAVAEIRCGVRTLVGTEEPSREGDG